MKLERFLLGAAGLASLAYAGWRWYETAGVLRDPQPPLPPDPKAYGRIRRTLTATGALRAAASTLAFAYGPPASLAPRALRPMPDWARPAVLAAAATLAGSALDGGIAFIEEHELERRFGLSDQSARAWAIDYIKATLLGAGVSAVLATLGGAAVRRFPRMWPLAGALGLIPLFVLANVVVPIYVLPLFNRFEPLHGPLETRIRELAARYGVGDAEILRMDMSRQTKKANAFVAGLGSTHRIVLGDTLIEHFPEDEILFVVAHEIGHYVHRDTWRMVAAAELASIGALAAAALTSARSADDGTARLLRIYAALATAMQCMRPALNAFSRSREWAADRFGRAATQDPASGARAFRRLRDQNLADEDVPAWYEFFFGSHPSLGRRITELERATP